MKNFVANETAIINASEATPEGIRLYFSEVLNMTERDTVTNVLDYWIQSTPIVGNDYAEYIWENSGQQLTIVTNFDKGSFDGDLLHRDAIGLGDEAFNMGLVKLFDEGYTPKTRRGKGIAPAGISPICIEFLYEKNIITEKLNDIITEKLTDVIAEKLTDIDREIMNAQRIKLAISKYIPLC